MRATRTVTGETLILGDDGLIYTLGDGVEEMSYPMQCTRCGHVHDAGKVETIARHADCSVWRCPRCKSTIDDRPDGYGGARKVNR